MLHHRERCNEGTHTLHLGGPYDSGLLVPFAPLAPFLSFVPFEPFAARK
jgi:hypothetical protein